MLECREVEVRTTDEGVAGIVPRREGYQVSDIDQVHCGAIVLL